MSDNIPRASTWAKRAPRGDVQLADLEAHLFKNHPEILAALGRRKRDNPDRTAAGSSPSSPLRAVKVVAAWVVFLAPLIGLIVLMPNEDIDSDTGVTIAQVCFYLAIPGPIYLAVAWWRRHRRMHMPDVWVLAAIAICGLFAVGAMTSWLGAVRSMAEPATWPMWLVAGLATLIVLVELTLSAGMYDIQSENFPKIGSPDTTRIDELVDALERSERKGLRTSRNRALKTLAERGIIDEPRKAEAQACDLGKLYTLDA